MPEHIEIGAPESESYYNEDGSTDDSLKVEFSVILDES